MIELALLILAGAGAGAFGALLGLGGGLLIVPILTLGFGLPLRAAVGTSLVCVVVTSSAAAAVYLQRDVANLRLGMTLELFTAAAALVGGTVAFALPEKTLALLFAALLAYVAVTMARSATRGRKDGGTPAVAAAGAAANAASVGSVENVGVAASAENAASAGMAASSGSAVSAGMAASTGDVRVAASAENAASAGMAASPNSIGMAASAGDVRVPASADFAAGSASAENAGSAAAAVQSARPAPDSYLDHLSGPGYRVRNLGFGILGSLFAGIVSALFGVGGGIVKVPVMNLVMGVPLRVATATSNLMIGVTASAGAIVYLMRPGGIEPFVAAPTALGVFAGASVVSRVAHRVDVRLLRLLFVAMLLYTAFQMASRALS